MKRLNYFILLFSMDKIQKRITAQINYQEAANSKSSFTDTFFPPELQSLISVDSKKDKLLTLCRAAKWVRARELFDKQKCELFQGVSINDIQQGELGDCYFLSSLAALAEFPARVQKIFITQTVNTPGCYCLSPYAMGQKINVTLDENVPVNNDNQCIFAGPSGEEIWALLLEKAWAKVNGSYANIESGNEKEALHFLTGAPTKEVTHNKLKSPDVLWEKLIDAVERNHIMTASCGGTGRPDDEYDKLGLITGHAYSLLHAQEITNNGNKVRLVQLRNPWGSHEWKGQWSDDWEGWTPELRSTLKETSADDGIFFMDFEDYITYYQATTICLFRDTHVHSSQKVENKDIAAHVFQIKSNIDGYIGIYGYPKRMINSEIPDYKPPYLFLFLGKLEATGVKLITSMGTGDCDEHQHVKLVPGDYIIFSGAAYMCPEPKGYIVDAYMSQGINLLEINVEMEVLAELGKEYAKSKKDSWQKGKHGITSFSECSYGPGLGFNFFVNESQS